MSLCRSACALIFSERHGGRSLQARIPGYPQLATPTMQRESRVSAGTGMATNLYDRGVYADIAGS